MIKLKALDGAKLPAYKTSHSSGADLRANESVVVPPLAHAKVRTGIYIESIDWELVPEGQIPEIQVRARSGLAAKYGIGLSNGVGTVDADYRDEICVLLWNSGEKEFKIDSGDRIAQLVQTTAYRFKNLEIEKETRSGGFGSTGV